VGVGQFWVASFDPTIHVREKVVAWDVSGFVRLFLILMKNKFLQKFYEKVMNKTVLLAKNKEYF